jgi:hypothetical protein
VPLMSDDVDMAASPCTQCRIDPQIKLRLQAIAVQRGLTESGLLKRLVIAAVGMAPANDAMVLAIEPIGPRARVYVRLRRSDHALLRERAAGRGLASATYVSMLVRTHLRNVAPLPDRELEELRNAVGALGAVGRNLNQIARIAHVTGRVEGLATADLRAMLAAFEGLRAHFKRLIETNIASWETDHAKTSY